MLALFESLLWSVADPDVDVVVCVGVTLLEEQKPLNPYQQQQQQ